ncbi:iron chelate uptake ABC transporter family permease subunit [Candidatus Phaeomarinobacter ectocarpi]|nr:iron chelate uptake ABC transporter family permease subunit [Candidatus Phaeomarinobacter ectocarpi]
MATATTTIPLKSTPMLDDFFVRAVLVAVGVAAMAGPLGCFVVWRRMAYFGDTTAHAALLGIGLGITLGIDLTIGVAAVTISVALLLLAMERHTGLALDTLLGILAHSSLALGVIVIALSPSLRVDLTSYLFGDVLSVSVADLAVIFGLAVAVLAALAVIWRKLVAATMDEELAAAEGINPARYRIALVLLLAVVIAVAMKVVGVLLVTALLIIPAAAARRLSSSPEQMALAAIGLAIAAAVGGLFMSLYLDTPSGPSIVIAAALIFSLSLLPLGPKRG